MPAAITAAVDGVDARTVARTAWQRRTLLVGGVLQAVFGALWLERGLHALVPSSAAVVVAGSTLVAGGTAAILLRRRAPWPRGGAARRIEVQLTTATVVQLAVAVALPILLGHLGTGRYTPAAIVGTTGLLLLAVHRLVDSPYHRRAGRLLVELAAVAALFGGARPALLALAAASVLLGFAAAGFARLARGAPPS